MEEKKVIEFKQDDKFFYRIGNQNFLNGNYECAVKYFLRAVDTSKNKSVITRCGYYLVLAQCYGMLHEFELSNFYYFRALECDAFMQMVMRGLGENFFQMGDDIMSRVYLNKCINFLESSVIAKSAKERLKDFSTKQKFKVVGKDNIDDVISSKIDEYMSKGNFEKVIKTLEEKSDFSNAKLRAELSLSYFLVGESEKSVQLLEKYGTDTALDLCNLCLVYNAQGDYENCEKIKLKMRQKEDLTPDEYFKVGLTFAEVGDLEHAKDFIKKFFELTGAREAELHFLYGLVCLNKGDTDEAKEIFIRLKNTHPYSKFLYNFYIELCSKKDREKVEYIFSVPMHEYLMVQRKLKSVLTFSPDELKTFFLQNTDMFYFLAKLGDSNLKSNLFLRLSKIKCDKLNEFFTYILLTNSAKSSLKCEILANRIAYNFSSTISLTKDDFYTKVKTTNMLSLSLTNKNLFEAVLMSVEYLISEFFLTTIDLRRIATKIDKVIKSNSQDNPNVLASFVVWSFVKDKKIVPLSKVCSYFSCSQEEFYRFIEKYNFDV